MSTNLGIPAQLQGVSPDVLTAQVNWAFNQLGAGSPIFWEIWGDMVFRDSTAKGLASGGALQHKTGHYPILTMGGVNFIPKADGAGRTRSEGEIGALVNTVRAYRVDNKAQPIPVYEGFDPTGMLWAAIQAGHMTWSNHLPQQLILRAFVLGQDLWGNSLPVGHDGKALYATDHPVNPNDRTNTDVYSNVYTLKSKVDEGEFTNVMDLVEQVPDTNGVTLPNAGAIPKIFVPSRKAGIRWRRFIGGKVMENLTDADKVAPIVPILVNGRPIGIYSCTVGGAQIIVDPYLRQIATDKVAAELTAFGFTGRGRPAMIYREEQPPQIEISGQDKRYEFKAIESVVDARVGAGYGDPRSTFKIIEKAS